MALMTYEPRDAMSRLQREINRIFEGGNSPWENGSDALSDWTPAVDIYEHDDHFALFVDLPGIRPEQVELTLENGVLTISGQREQRVGDNEAQSVRSRLERGSGRFFRRFMLPRSVDQEKVQAHSRNGVLEVVIPKQAAAQPRRIEIAA